MMKLSLSLLKKLSWLAIVAIVIQFPVSAQGETTKPAFVSPDGNNVAAGYWRGFFYPNAFFYL